MLEGFQLPALLLTVLLLPAFVRRYWRSRDTRSLLWMLGFGLAALRMAQVHPLGLWDFSDPGRHPWIAAAGLSCALVSSVLFLASLSPLGFRIRGVRVLYAIPFVLPLVVYAVLLDGVYGQHISVGTGFLVFPALGAISLLVGCFWAFSRGTMPSWMRLTLCILLGGTGFRLCLTVGGEAPLVFVVGALHLTAALLIFYGFRRVSPGTLLTGLGFFTWSIALGDLYPAVASSPALHAGLLQVSSLGGVVAAVGLLLLALEDDLTLRKSALEREREARKELEAYTGLILSRRRLEDFDRQAALICQTVAEHSRFRQVALLVLLPSGKYRLVGAAGLDDAAHNALEALAGRLPASGFLVPGSQPPFAPGSQSLNLSLEPWLLPGDDLERLRLTQVVATPLYGRSSTDGVFLLMDLRDPGQTLRAEDLLPIEVFAARIQASRNQTQMMEKLIEAEKFAGLGQLAGSVARQLNNPLTVILGYASLLEVSNSMNPQERRGIESILAEARNMRSTLESLSRMSHTKNEHFSTISVNELLSDMEQLHRSEFMHRGIDFRLHVTPALPRVLGNAQQVRQAVLYCLQFAMEAVDHLASSAEKSVRIDATAANDSVKILIAHSGPGFLHPARAFDPFVPIQAVGETAGLGLSLCATILRENNGRISAVNQQPRGAALILELQAT
ncbi:MAG TPA: histidine kinase dimerization/phospho-acceptor domain-containing protein [Terracidiphilus sp.]|nr:histidine kinase dimerization/phospho-acceptor domain-containing protein [Terracidiphilus sp.]